MGVHVAGIVRNLQRFEDKWSKPRVLSHVSAQRLGTRDRVGHDRTRHDRTRGHIGRGEREGGVGALVD